LTYNNQRQAIAKNDVQVCGGSAPQRMAAHLLDQEIGLRQRSNVNSDRICSDLCVAVAASQTPKVIPAYMRACQNLAFQPPIAPLQMQLLWICSNSIA
jgi:hypothetical protein